VIRVGIADSGIDGAARGRVVAAVDVSPSGEIEVPSLPRDLCGHGSTIAALIASPTIELLDARIFDRALRTSAVRAAASIDWLVEQHARIINLSIGLREDRVVLREACARAVAGGVLVVASAPARGAPVFPASYPGIVRATGDARCKPGEISWLDGPTADFGGCVRAGDDATRGASVGCANVTAAIAAWLAKNPDAADEDAVEALRRSAKYHGPERHGFPDG
jgi:hypothetical protein